MFHNHAFNFSPEIEELLVLSVKTVLDEVRILTEPFLSAYQGLWRGFEQEIR